MSGDDDLALLAEAVARGTVSGEALERVGNWSGLLDRAARFMVLPTLAEALVKVPLPPPVRATLNEARANTAARNGLLVADLALACAALGAASLPFIVLKGGAMLIAGTIHPAGRHLEDIDVMVPSLEPSVACLERVGFRFQRHLGYDGMPARDVEAPGWGPHGTLLELHPEARGFDAAYAAAIEARVGDAIARIPSPPALLDQLSRHVLVHHAGAPLYLARHLADVRALAATPALGWPARVSVALRDAVERTPRRWGAALFPSGLQLRARVALADDAVFVASLVPLLRRPRAIFDRLFPDAAYVIERHGDASTATYLRRLLRLKSPVR